MEIIQGDLLMSQSPVIVQQLNCLCVRPHGLSKIIADKYLYANIYGKRRGVGRRNLAIPEDQGIPGDIEISYPPKSGATRRSDPKHLSPIVVGIYGQYDYGKCLKNPYYRTARRTTYEQDNPKLRELWFQQALDKLKLWMISEGHRTVAFPHSIGCGLAGGHWPTYLRMIADFAEDAPFTTQIYQLE